MARKERGKAKGAEKVPVVVVVRRCHGLAEFGACFEIQRAVWGSSDADLTPLPLFVVAAETGGQVLGAFAEDRMVGFTLALAGARDRAPFLHSHMTAVLEGWRDRGIGRRLKLLQREDALSRGIELVEWTFDPLQIKNAYFNLVRLGAFSRRYLPNQYGMLSSPLQAGLPTDRLVAEWQLRSARARRVVSARPMAESAPRKSAKARGRSKVVRIRVPAELASLRHTRPEEAVRMQAEIRQEFEHWLNLGYAATSVTVAGQGGGVPDAALGERLTVRLLRVTLREIRMPLVTPFETSFGRTEVRRILLVEADVDGAIGWGECVAGEGPFYGPETVETAWHVLRDFLWPAVRGKEFGAAAEIEGMLSAIRGHNMAKGALEAAVWDAEARHKGLPLWKLLGGVSREIPCGVSIGLKENDDELECQVEKELAAGYQRIKIKIKPGRDVAPVARLRQRFPRIRLMVDANSAYQLRDLPILQELEAYYLMMIEQPLGWDDIWSHAELQRKLKTPICLDECIHSDEHARAAIALGACGIINIKLGRVGGYSAARRIHDLCQEKSIPVWCGGMLESGIGRAHNIALSTLANFTLPGDVTASRRYWTEDIIEPEVTVSQQGTIGAPSGPGIGYEPRRARIEALAVRREELV